MVSRRVLLSQNCCPGARWRFSPAAVSGPSFLSRGDSRAWSFPTRFFRCCEAFFRAISDLDSFRLSLEHFLLPLFGRSLLEVTLSGRRKGKPFFSPVLFRRPPGITFGRPFFLFPHPRATHSLSVALFSLGLLLLNR